MQKGPVVGIVKLQIGLFCVFCMFLYSLNLDQPRTLHLLASRILFLSYIKLYTSHILCDLKELIGQIRYHDLAISIFSLHGKIYKQSRQMFCFR